MQHLARPLLPRGVVKCGVEWRPVAAKGAQVAAIALRAFGTAVKAVEQQAVESPVLLVLEGKAVHVGRRRGQQVTRCMGVLAVDQARQLTNAAAFPEAP
ncbi:hypothetical protein D3C76_1469270 [compost metagenome]